MDLRAVAIGWDPLPQRHDALSIRTYRNSETSDDPGSQARRDEIPSIMATRLLSFALAATLASSLGCDSEPVSERRDSGAFFNVDASAGADAGGTPDAGQGDAGPPEADAGVADAGTEDAGVPVDAGAPRDAGSMAGAGNPDSVGRGVRRAIVIDGLNLGDEWGADTLLIRDPAADDARFLGENWSAHEAPWDYAGLHAAWDDTYLYIGIQYVNVTDVLDGSNFGSSEGSPIQVLDTIQFLVFDVIAGEGYSIGGDMWTKDQEFVGADLPDYQLYFHSNFSQEGTYLARWDGVALTQFTDGLLSPELVGAGGEFLADTQLLGVDPHGDDATPGDYGATVRDYLMEGHSAAYDTFFELQIPLALLGIDAARLDGGTIGVFAANGDGSAVDSVPNDPATSDTPGTSDSNSPLEWSASDDDDQYSVPFALVGGG